MESSQWKVFGGDIVFLGKNRLIWNGKERDSHNSEISLGRTSEELKWAGQRAHLTRRWLKKHGFAPGHVFTEKSFPSQLFSWQPRGSTSPHLHSCPPCQLSSPLTWIPGCGLLISLSASIYDFFTILNLQIISQIRSLLQWLSSSEQNLNLNKSTGSYMSWQSSHISDSIPCYFSP